MPTVPVSGGPRVGLGVAPGVKLSAPNVSIPEARLNLPQINLPQFRTPQFNAPRMQAPQADPRALQRVEVSDLGARQFIGGGQELEGAGRQLGQLVMGMQVKVNATVVDDALNDAREAARKLTWGEQDGQGGMVGGYRNVKGYDAIKRPSGQALDAEVGEAFDKAVKEIASSKITNEHQRAAYEAQVADIANQLRQGATVWQTEQFDQYHTGVYTSMAKNLVDDFTRLDPGDIASQRDAMSKIDAATATLAATQGASAQALELGQRAARGAAVSGLFDRMLLEKKYDTAQALINEWGDSIDANAATKMKAALDGRVGVVMGEQIAADAWSQWGEGAYTAETPDRAFNIMVGMESRGRQVDEGGKIVTSKAGARGVAQLMPDTAKEVAKSLGRPELADLAFTPTKEGEAANRLLGETYFRQMLTRYKGDVQKAMAAYNAGPGRVDDALAKARDTGENWRNHLPAETQAYVANGTKSLGEGRGVPRKPTRSEMLARIDARTDDPDVRRAAYSWMDRRMSAAEADERDQNEASYAEALRQVRENGGNINALSPELQARVRPDQLSTVQTYAKNIADGTYTVTDPAAYYLATDPTVLAKMTPNQLEALRPQLDEQTFNRVRTMWADAQTPEPGKGPKSLDVSTLNSLIDTRLEYLGLNPNPDKKDTAGRARIGAIRQFAHQWVLNRQEQSGKKFTEYEELQTVVNEMFTRNQSIDWKTGALGLYVKTGERDLPVLTTELNKLPQETVQRVTRELERHLKRKPSEAEIYGAYFRRQFYSTGGGNAGR